MEGSEHFDMTMIGSRGLGDAVASVRRLYAWQLRPILARKLYESWTVQRRGFPRFGLDGCGKPDRCFSLS